MSANSLARGEIVCLHCVVNRHGHGLRAPWDVACHHQGCAEVAQGAEKAQYAARQQSAPDKRQVDVAE